MQAVYCFYVHILARINMHRNKTSTQELFLHFQCKQQPTHLSVSFHFNLKLLLRWKRPIVYVDCIHIAKSQGNLFATHRMLKIFLKFSFLVMTFSLKHNLLDLMTLKSNISIFSSNSYFDILFSCLTVSDSSRIFHHLGQCLLYYTS